MKTTMTRRTILLVAVAVALALSACDSGDSAATPSSSIPNSTTSTSVSPPSEDNVASFRGIAPPTFAIYSAESGDKRAPCREYTSSETPYTVVTGHTEDLTALGWTVSNLIRSGYRHEHSASFDATKGGRTIRAEASGTGPASSSYSVCIIKSS